MTFENITFSEDLAFLNTNIDDAKRMLTFCDRRGARGWKSDRSCQEPSNEYLVAKIGVDIADNEPPKVRSIFKLRDLVFANPPRSALALKLLILPSHSTQCQSLSLRHSPPVSHLSFVVVLPATSVLLVQ